MVGEAVAPGRRGLGSPEVPGPAQSGQESHVGEKHVRRILALLTGLFLSLHQSKDETPLNDRIRKVVGEPAAASHGFWEADTMREITHRLVGLPLGEFAHSLGFYDVQHGNT
uniref:Uncharacterized protein n=1 Tax=Sphaerodactylus townsendi TaxID=933632 RepID=A0ACB8EU85_9SAUR